MAKDKAPPEPPADIPAWFMTYSDVITLLMTFFILLLTFSTTEPEKFEKVQLSAFGSAGASGVAGHKIDALENKSWVQRVRPRAARIAMHGSEMPPMQDEPSSAAVGRGLESPTEEEQKKDTMTSNAFLVPLDYLVDNSSRITPRGIQLAKLLAGQFQELPVHGSIEISNKELAERASVFLTHLYHVQGVRAGQVGLAYTAGVDSDSIKIVIERFEK